MIPTVSRAVRMHAQTCLKQFPEKITEQEGDAILGQHIKRYGKELDITQ